MKWEDIDGRGTLAFPRFSRNLLARVLSDSGKLRCRIEGGTAFAAASCAWHRMGASIRGCHRADQWPEGMMWRAPAHCFVEFYSTRSASAALEPRSHLRPRGEEAASAISAPGWNVRTLSVATGEAQGTAWPLPRATMEISKCPVQPW